MNVKDMVYLIRHRVGDELKNKGIPPQLYIKVINDALDFVIEDHGGLFQEYTGSSVDGTYEMPLPTNCKDLEWVYYDGEPLKYITHLELYQTSSIDTEDVAEGTPQYWTTKYVSGTGLVLQLYPCPGEDDKTIRIGCRLQYGSLSASDYATSFTLPEYMQDAVVDYATFLMFRELGNRSKMEIWKPEAIQQVIKARPTRKGNRLSQKFD